MLPRLRVGAMVTDHGDPVPGSQQLCQHDTIHFLQKRSFFCRIPPVGGFVCAIDVQKHKGGLLCRQQSSLHFASEVCVHLPCSVLYRDQLHLQQPANALYHRCTADDCTF